MLPLPLSIFLGFLLFLSLAFNVFLFHSLKKSKKTPVPSLELQEFLGDLMGGRLGMIAVARVDQSQLLMRSPRIQ